MKHPEPGRREPHRSAFSILERIDVGETQDGALLPGWEQASFSILERIDVGETASDLQPAGTSASFQYPRTDRRG